MKMLGTPLPEVRILVPQRHGDDRGFFSETYSRRVLAEHGIDFEFVQDNHSLSAQTGTVRGLHFQIPPFAQPKLLRVTRGAVYDVAVDLRHGSATFGRHAGFTLSAEEGNQIFIPEGFAHGLCTLEPDTEVLYKVANYYSAAHERGVRWNDPALGIDWPVSPKDAILSAKDRDLPLLSELPRWFVWSGVPAATSLSA